MMTDNDRPQDVGRRHGRTRREGGADRALIERYQATMRDELGALLDELAPKVQDQGLGMVAIPPKRPDLTTRSKIWDLAIKLGRELGTAIDPDPLPSGPAAPSRPRARKRVDYGGT